MHYFKSQSVMIHKEGEGGGVLFPHEVTPENLVFTLGKNERGVVTVEKFEVDVTDSSIGGRKRLEVPRNIQTFFEDDMTPRVYIRPDFDFRHKKDLAGSGICHRAFAWLFRPPKARAPF